MEVNPRYQFRFVLKNYFRLLSHVRVWMAFESVKVEKSGIIN
jgi:hypothetical protein